MTVPLTFLFTDLENSTPLWEQFPEEMQQASARHDALIRGIIEQHQGRVVKTTGDGFHAVFESPSDGVAAALAGQQAITVEPWPEATGPLKVRMGLHTGKAWLAQAITTVRRSIWQRGSWDWDMAGRSCSQR